MKTVQYKAAESAPEQELHGMYQADSRRAVTNSNSLHSDLFCCLGNELYAFFTSHIIFPQMNLISPPLSVAPSEVEHVSLRVEWFEFVSPSPSIESV